MDRNGEILWELRHVSKYFSGVQALDDVSVQFRKGEIHALIGENGSGKSTLIKCLSGVHQPEEGILLHNGKQINITNPIVARKHGVATIFQEFSLVPTLSVAENIFLGRLPAQNNGKGLISWDIMCKKAKEILNKLDIEIDPNVIVNKLSVAQQQLVEIAKALSMDATLLIMDEPTTALGLSEIERLHQLTRKLRDEGYSIIYISHRLDELVNLVDFVTVLKDGKVTGECKKEDINVNEIVRIMIGSDIANHYPKQCNVQDEVLFRAKGLETAEGVYDITLDVKRGEVLGLAGLIGSGRTEIARAIFGADQLIKGSIEMCGRKVPIEKPAHAIKNGIAFITENRKTDGLFMN
ncbi:MAG TPA: sugar ABC transporter ATP-binding protein, partial [Syntrophomonas sp.]|nr:sugar ABC transporter ATP-binding protein [Syntrophomonas sp.]